MAFASPYQRYRQALRAVFSPGRPSFLIIGAQKAGTTALHDILAQHSQIDSARRKEIHFFDHDQWYARRWLRPYFLLFPPRSRANRAHLFFEATPNYLYHPDAAHRIKAYNPKMKLIVLLREPASRARSGWAMSHYQLNPENRRYPDSRSFPEAIADSLARGTSANARNDKRGYVARGLYALQLERVFRQFPREQVLILENRQLLQNYEAAINQVQDFIGVPRENLPFLRRYTGKVDSKSNLYPEEMAALHEFFRPHNEALFKLLGHDYGWNDRDQA
jgi:hypothetical protein